MVIRGSTWFAATGPGRVHTTVEPSVQAHPLPDAAVAMKPAGTSSVTVMGPGSASGPSLFTSTK